MSDVVVLCYHAVCEDWGAELAVTPRRFEEQLRTLVARGYRGATFTEAATAPPHSKTIAVTFDDGMRSVLDRARPVLADLGLPATVFVPTDFVGAAEPMRWRGIERWLDSPHRDELVPLTWAELVRLRDGGWEIGSHTRTHARLIHVGDEALVAELTESRARLEAELGEPCRSVAYPFGEVDARIVDAARAAGYEAACALSTNVEVASPLAWPRIGIWRSDGPISFRIKVSRSVRSLQGSRTFALLDRRRRTLKRILRPKRVAQEWRS